MKWKKLMSLLVTAALTSSFICGTASNPVTAETASDPAGVTTSDSDVSAKGTNPVGDLLASDISGELDQKPLVEGYAIFEVRVDGGLVSANIEAAKDCKLVVGIYSDTYGDGAEMLYGTTVVDVKAGVSTVEAALTVDPMPQYYQVHAYLIGADEVPLTAEYTNPMYTKGMRDLLDSDIHDYDDYSMINLDSDESTNFLVYQKDVQFAVSDGKKNVATYTEGSNVYEIKNYDGPTEPGTIVAVVSETEIPPVFRIKSVETKGDVTTIHADPTLQSSDVFAFAKLESGDHVTESTYTPPETTEDGPTVTILDQPSKPRPGLSAAAEGEEETAETINSKEIQIRLRLEKKGSKDFFSENKGLGEEVTDDYEDEKKNHIGLSFEAGYSIGIDVTIGVEWNYYISLTNSHFDNEVSIDGELTGELALTASLSVPLGSTSFWIGSCVSLIVSPVIRIEAAAAATFTEKLSLHYSSNTGWNNNSDVDALKLSGSVFVGIGFVAEIKLFDHIGANLEAYAGIRFNSASVPRHEGCKFCVAGVYGFEASVSFYAGVSFIPGANIALGATVFVPLGDFYASIPGGFGFGKCPNADKIIQEDPENPENPEDPEDPTEPEIPDGLTDEQRDALQLVEIKKTGAFYDYDVEVKKDKLNTLTSIQLPSSYKGGSVVRVGSGLGNSGISRTYNHRYSCSFAPLLDCTGGFTNSKTIQNVSIPSSVNEIAKYAFYGTKSLRSLKIPSSVDEIGEAAFAYGGLTSVTLPAGLDVVKKCTFLSCEQLRRITFPAYLEKIEEGAFAGCTSLTTLTLPSHLKSLGLDAFAGCTSLRTVRIPKSLKSFPFDAFANCDSLEWVLIENPQAEIGAPDDLFARYDHDKIKIYGYTDSTAQTFAEEYNFEFIPLDPRPAETTAPDVTTPVEQHPAQTMTFTDLKPNTVYNFYDLLGEDFLAENLLYLAQGTTDESGALTIWYRPAKEDSAAKKYVRCYEPETTAPVTTTSAQTTKPVSKIKGDANCDFSVDVSDVVLLARFCVEDVTVRISSQGIRNGDVNHDNNTDGDDLIPILKYIARMIDSFD